MTHNVFISYSTKDENMAQQVCHVLEQNGIRCWIAPRNLRTGNDYVEQVVDAIKSAKLVVLIGSDNSFNSQFVTNEISLAFNNGVPILPFIIDTAFPRDKMKYYLMNTQWIPADCDLEENLRKLVYSALKILDGKSDDVGKVSNVHITYSSRNQYIAQAVCYVLEQNGIICWIPPRDLIAGQDFPIQINDSIKNAKLIVLIASKDSYESRYVGNEIDVAFGNNIPILSFKVDDSIPEGRMKYYLTQAKWIDGFPDHRNVLDDLVSCVNLLLRKGESQDFDVEIRNYWEIDNAPFKEKSQDDEAITLKRPFDAYSGDEPYIFVSYAHKDSDLVFREIEKFHDAGYHVWYDQGLTAGQEWDEEIEDALMDSSLLVVFISENSMASNNVVDEIKLALEEKIDIVPIYLEEAKLAKGLKLRLSQKHEIFKYKSYEDDYLEQCFKAFDKAGIPCEK